MNRPTFLPEVIAGLATKRAGRFIAGGQTGQDGSRRIPGSAAVSGLALVTLDATQFQILSYAGREVLLLHRLTAGSRSRQRSSKVHRCIPHAWFNRVARRGCGDSPAVVDRIWPFWLPMAVADFTATCRQNAPVENWRTEERPWLRVGRVTHCNRRLTGSKASAYWLQRHGGAGVYSIDSCRDDRLQGKMSLRAPHGRAEVSPSMAYDAAGASQHDARMIYFLLRSARRRLW